MDIHTEVIAATAHITVEGDLTEALGLDLVGAVTSLPEGVDRLELRMGECDVDDAIGVIEAINAIRHALRRGVPVTLFEAPHILAHDLYRVNLLSIGSGLTLVEPRQEVPYG